MMRWILPFTASLGLMAQDGIQGPLVGWTYEASTASLRAVQGIPGSSMLGARAGAGLRAAAAAPGGAYAVAIAAETGEARVLDLRNGESRELDVAEGADGIFLSPRGTAAVLHYREQGRAVLLTGLPGDAVVAAQFESSASSFAVSDDGKAVMAVEDAGVRLFDGDGNQWNLNHSEAVVHAAFLEGRHDAVLAGPTGAYLVREANANASVEKLWEGDAVAAAVEGNTAVVAERNGGLLAVDLRNHEVRRLECACTPVTLVRMSQAVYRVHELAEGPLWLVDLNGSTPRAVFVPADAKPEPTEQ